LRALTFAPCISSKHTLSAQFWDAARNKLEWRGVAGDERADALAAMPTHAPVRLTDEACTWDEQRNRARYAIDTERRIDMLEPMG
jgi:hypothetical protein